MTIDISFSYVFPQMKCLQELWLTVTYTQHSTLYTVYTATLGTRGIDHVTSRDCNHLRARFHFQLMYCVTCVTVRSLFVPRLYFVLILTDVSGTVQLTAAHRPLILTQYSQFNGLTLYVLVETWTWINAQYEFVPITEG